MGKQYKLYTNTTGSNNGVASLKIVKSGRIRSVLASISATGGAGVGRMQFEISKQNTSSLTTSDTPETVIASFAIAYGNAVTTAENAITLCDIPVEVGETIYINTAFTGAAAPTAQEAQFYLFT